MIRARLRGWLLRLAFGMDPSPLLSSLRRAAASVRAARAEQRGLLTRVERLEQTAIVAVDPADGDRLRERLDPYFETVGVLFCTSADARAVAVEPLERTTVE